MTWQVCAHPKFAHIKHKMKVLHRPAHDFTAIPDDYFDVVVMNAMVSHGTPPSPMGPQPDPAL